MEDNFRDGFGKQLIEVHLQRVYLETGPPRRRRVFGDEQVGKVRADEAGAG